MATIGTLTASLQLESAAFVSNLNKAAGAMQQSARQMEQQTGLMQRGFSGVSRAADVLKTGLAGLGVAVGIGGLVRLTRSAIDSGDALLDTSKRTGIAVEALQALEFAAQRTGSSAAAIDKALEQFNKRLGEAAVGTGELKDFLEAHNVALTDSQGNFRATTDILGEYADLIANAGSAQEKAALAAAAFGRTAGSELIPLLSEGSAGLAAYSAEVQRLGVITADQAEAAANANDALDNLNQATSTATQSLLIAAAPAFEAVAKGLTNLIVSFKSLDPETQKAIGAFGLVVAAATPLLAILGPIALGIAALVSPIGLVVAGIVGAGGLAFAFRNELGAAFTAASNAITEVVAAFKRLSTEALAAVQALVTGVEQWLGGRLQAAFDAAAAPIQATIDAFRGMYEAVVGQSYVPDMVIEIGGWMERLEPAMVEPARRATALTAAEFAALPDRIQKSIGDFAGWHEILAKGPAEAAAEGASQTSNAFAGALDDIASSFTNIFSEVLEDGVESFSDLADQAQRIFTSLSASIGETLGSSFASLGAFGGPLGSIFGASAGIAAGFGISKLVGSLFGGGGPTGSKITFGRGALGSIGIGGTNEASGFIRDFDQQMISLLNERQTQIADRQLQNARNVSALFGDEGPSANDLARLAASRVAPTARALGFRPGAIAGRGRAPEEQLALLNEAIQLERSIEDITGAVTPFQRAMRDLRTEFAEANARAKEFGISTKGMGRALREAEEELREQRRLERRGLRLQLEEVLGGGNSLNVAIAGIRLRFDELEESARNLNIPLKLVREAERAAIRQAIESAKELRAQQQAALNAAALSIGDPFEALSDPLRDFQQELDRTLLNPAQLLARAQADFDRLAREARGGDLGAIAELREAGQFLIQESGRFGSSPGQVEATREVRSVISDVLRDVDRAQREAGRNVQDEIRRASRAEIDTLRELVNVAQETADEIRKMARELRQGRKA